MIVAAPQPEHPALDGGFEYPFQSNPASLTGDFAARDAIAQSHAPHAVWYERSREGEFMNGGWGPQPIVYPRLTVPPDAGADALTWRRERVLRVALRYLNVRGNPHALDYRHHHIPAWDPPTNTHASGDSGAPEVADLGAWAEGSGLDCSNFASWVYNFALGIKFTSSVRGLSRPALGVPARRLDKDGTFQLGDLVYMHPTGDKSRVSHVVLYINDDFVVDARYDFRTHDGEARRGVLVRPRRGWYRHAVVGGWRII